jgi:hypothetical protein
MRPSLHKLIFATAFIVTAAVYWPGLSGSFLFDDYPNIVDNHDVQSHEATLPSLVRAALSSPSSEFKRPLASLSFAANYLATGLNPFWMKLTNLVIHLLNGLLVYLLTKALVQSATVGPPLSAAQTFPPNALFIAAKTATPDNQKCHANIVAAVVAAGWMLLPINLTAVLYVVQRMESMANLFVLLGLIGYVTGRRRMLAVTNGSATAADSSYDWTGFWLCVASITLPTAIGLLAKETAVLLPLYALLIEWLLFGFGIANPSQAAGRTTRSRDKCLLSLFLLVLALPLIAGLTWVLPDLLQPERWVGRDFTLGTRLLSEARIVVDYIVWTLLPTPHALSFYHDNFNTSTGLLTPWTTLACIFVLAGLVALIWWLRSRDPLTALGIALFLGCQLLTATVLPLELVYEHRNYFASFGLLLAIVPLLTASASKPTSELPFFAMPRRVLLAGLLLLWAGQTALTALAWSNPLHLAEDLAARAPDSPRAQYELGRTYIIYSHYDPTSPFTRLAYAPLEKAAAFPGSSILPEQALIFMNARMHMPLKDAWWDSVIAKLKTHKPGVQDESSLGALTQCARDGQCELPKQRMMDAYLAALSHPNPSSRLLAMYGDYAWNILQDHALGEHMTEEAVRITPNEPAYRTTLIRMLAAQGRKAEAKRALEQLEPLNIGGRLNGTLDELRALPNLR